MANQQMVPGMVPAQQKKPGKLIPFIVGLVIGVALATAYFLILA